MFKTVNEHFICFSNKRGCNFTAVEYFAIENYTEPFHNIIRNDAKMAIFPVVLGLFFSFLKQSVFNGKCQRVKFLQGTNLSTILKIFVLKYMTSTVSTVIEPRRSIYF